MKKSKNDVELRKENGQNKRPYQKPSLDKINLFADNVLSGTCMFFIGSDCNEADVCRNGGPM